MKILIDMRFIKNWDGHKLNEIIAVTKANAGILEAQGVAVRVQPSHAKRKPITSAHTVTKEK